MAHVFVLHLTEYREGKEYYTENLHFTKMENLEKYLLSLFPYAQLSPPFNYGNRTNSYYIRNNAWEITFRFHITKPKLYDDVLETAPKAWGQDSDYEVYEIFPVEYANKLQAKFWEYFKGLGEDFKDSGRIGLVDDPESMKDYDKFKSCCGRDDTVVEVEGVKYMFGCNFGH